MTTTPTRKDRQVRATWIAVCLVALVFAVLFALVGIQRQEPEAVLCALALCLFAGVRLGMNR